METTELGVAWRSLGEYAARANDPVELPDCDLELLIIGLRLFRVLQRRI
jgi:hypothetical protein